MLLSFNFIISLDHKGLEAVQKELKDDEALPKLLVFGIALIGLGLLIANTALVAWFIIRKRIKGKKLHESDFFLLFAFSLVEMIFRIVLFNLFSRLELMLVPIVGQFVRYCFYVNSLGRFSLWLLFSPLILSVINF